MSLRNIKKIIKYLYNIDGKLFHCLKINAYKLSKCSDNTNWYSRRERSNKNQEIDIDTGIETGEGKAEDLLPSDIFKAQKYERINYYL
jgi:hypothetical protein